MRQMLSPASRWLIVIVTFAVSLIVLALSNPGRVLAFDGSGDGTSGSPYQITTCVQLQSIDLDLAAYYELTNDIDCSGMGVSWSPIGASGGFTGTFDGQGYDVVDLDLSGISSSTSFAGMFSTIENTAIVKDFSIINGKVNGGSNIGMVAGALNDTATLDNVYVQAAVTCHADNCGGLVGSLRGDSVINDCGADVTVVSDNQSVGGLVGWISGAGTIQESFANGHMTGTLYIGGLVGAVNNGSSIATITNAYANATVVASADYAGGLVGLGITLNLTNAYAVGSVSGGDSIGGLVGIFSGFMAETFAANSVAGTGSSVGPVTGHFASGSVGNRYFDTNITGFASSPDGSSPITDSDFFINNSSNPPMNTWNFSTMWRTNYASYPSFAPKMDPYMLCEEPSSTDTTMSGYCDVLPLGWGTPLWEARWSLRGADQWHAITLGNINQAAASVSDLTPGTWYDLQFRYTNDFGTGPWGTLVILTTGSAPVVPAVSINPSHMLLRKTVYETSESRVEDIDSSAPSFMRTPEDKTPLDTSINADDTVDTLSGFPTYWYWLGGGFVVFLAVGLFLGFRSHAKA